MGKPGLLSVVVEVSAFDELPPSAADSGGDSVGRVVQPSQALVCDFLGQTRYQLGRFHFAVFGNVLNFGYVDLVAFPVGYYL